MRREVRFAVGALRRRATVGLAGWSVPEALPAAGSGFALAQAVDRGFLAGRPGVGLLWLGGMLAMSVVGAVGSRMVFRRLGDLAEPLRDDLVRRVVDGALRHAVAGHPDDGALARLTRQVEIVRDTYAGLLMALRGFLVTVVGVVVGLLSLAPVVAMLIMPPFLLGFAAFVAMLGLAAARQRDAVLADERLATAAGLVLAGARDVTASGTEDRAAAMVAGPIAEQATAERRLAGVAALRTLCFAVGGWLPLLVLLLAGGWLVDRGLTAGALMGGLTYVLFGLQPALQNVVSGVGGSGLRFVVTLGRLLDATAAPPDPATRLDPAAPPDPTTRLDPAAPPNLAARPDPAAKPGSAARPGLAAPFDPAAPPARPDPPAPPGPPAKLGSAARLGPAARPGPATRPGTATGHDIRLRRVSFAYGPHAEPVLRDLDLTIPAGEHLAVVGPSGIGKSTLVSLLCGLRGPDAGTVTVGGVAATGLPVDRRAALRVLIPQEAYVFAGTLRDNLTYLCPDPPARDLDAAVAAVGAAALAARLGGYDATVRPAELSAGERQLVALVRAHLSPAPVAVLDEATCHLDPVAERRAEEAFAGRAGTLIVIAHRISSAMRADRVLVLDGTGAAVGDHATLAATSPLYRELVGHWRPATTIPTP